MKKIIFGLFIVLCISSCQSHPDTQLPFNSNSIPDATAFGETYMGLSLSCPVCASNPYVQVGIVAAAVVIGADASAGFGRSNGANFTNGKTNDINLPMNYYVNNNPFETEGLNHNTVLNYINQKSNFDEFITKINNYDTTAWLEVLNLNSGNIDLQQKMNAIQYARDFDIVAKLQQKRIVLSEQSSSFNIDNYLAISELSQPAKNDIKLIVTEFNNKNSQSLISATEYLNFEIQRKLKIEEAYTVEESTILNFLTVLKHSNYYWSK